MTTKTPPLSPSEKMVRTTITLPPELRHQLDYVSGRLGITKSALVTQLLMPSIQDLHSLLTVVPENPTPEDTIRARGKSNELILARLQSLRSIEGDLLDDRDL